MAKIANTDLDVFPLNLGGNVFGWTADVETSEAILDAYASAGGNFIDTADGYSAWAPGNDGGESERIIGNWMKARGNRSQMIIATKVGSRGGLSAKNIQAKVEDSLSRLQTDYIDLYYMHKDDTDTPLEKTMSTLNDLVEAGKIRNIAASNYSADRLQRLMDISEENGWARVVVFQPEYNLMERNDFETNLAPICERYNLAVMPYYSLASGFLTGKYRPEQATSDSVRSGSAAAYLERPNAAAVLQTLGDLSTKHGVSVSAISLAWLAAQPTVAAPIASARTTDQLRDLLEFAEVRLSDDDVKALTIASQ